MAVICILFLADGVPAQWSGMAPIQNVSGVVVALHGNSPWGQLNGALNGGGTYYVILQMRGTYINQTIGGLSPGKRYVLSFTSANRPGYGNGQENLAVTVDGRPLPGGVFQPPETSFTSFSLTFTAWGTSAVIAFANTRCACAEEPVLFLFVFVCFLLHLVVLSVDSIKVALSLLRS